MAHSGGKKYTYKNYGSNNVCYGGGGRAFNHHNPGSFSNAYLSSTKNAVAAVAAAAAVSSYNQHHRHHHHHHNYSSSDKLMMFTASTLTAFGGMLAGKAYVEGSRDKAPFSSHSLPYNEYGHKPIKSGEPTPAKPHKHKHKHRHKRKSKHQDKQLSPHRRYSDTGLTNTSNYRNEPFDNPASESYSNRWSTHATAPSTADHGNYGGFGPSTFTNNSQHRHHHYHHYDQQQQSMQTLNQQQQPSSNYLPPNVSAAAASASWSYDSAIPNNGYHNGHPQQPHTGGDHITSSVTPSVVDGDLAAAGFPNMVSKYNPKRKSKHKHRPSSIQEPTNDSHEYTPYQYNQETASAYPIPTPLQPHASYSQAPPPNNFGYQHSYDYQMSQSVPVAHSFSYPQGATSSYDITAGNNSSFYYLPSAQKLQKSDGAINPPKPKKQVHFAV